MIENITAKDINLTFNEFEALKNINFELGQAKIYGLIGRNGAGKTSLLSILAAYQKASSGGFYIDDEAVFENQEKMSQISFTHEKNYKDDTSKIKEYIELAQRYRPTFDIEYAEALIKKFKLPKNKALKSLSKGMQSAFDVTIGLANRTPITIFDEAYQGMDAPTREIFYNEILEEQTRQPRIFILSTHLVSEMAYLFDEVLLIHQGQLLIHEDMNTILENSFTITGDAAAIDQAAERFKPIHQEQLGGTKSIKLYQNLSREEIKQLEKNNLEIGQMSLNDLFIHMTEEEV